MMCCKTLEFLALKRASTGIDGLAGYAGEAILFSCALRRFPARTHP